VTLAKHRPTLRPIGASEYAQFRSVRRGTRIALRFTIVSIRGGACDRLESERMAISHDGEDGTMRTVSTVHDGDTVVAPAKLALERSPTGRSAPSGVRRRG
jgi:hypothetical protein